MREREFLVTKRFIWICLLALAVFALVLALVFPHYVGKFFMPQAAVEWCTAVGEFVVAYVIAREMEETRREKFFEHASDIEYYRDRAAIYSTFYTTKGDLLESRRKSFCDQIWSDGKQRDDEDDSKLSLKDRCERQIVLFGKLGQIRRRALFFKKDYVELFPHAVVGFWIMLYP